MGSCIYSDVKADNMYLQDHVILFVQEGIYKVRFGNQEYVVRKNEMILLQKAIVIEYEKCGEPDSGVLDYMMFFLKDELLNEFIKMSNLKHSYPVSLNDLGRRGVYKSQRRSKPIFLSLGYSVCHWWHVHKRYYALISLLFKYKKGEVNSVSVLS